MKGTIREYSKYNIKMLRLAGLWTDADGIFETKYYWIYYLFITIGCTGLFNFTQFMYILTVFNDLEEMATAAYLFLICAMANVKAFFFLKKFKLFKSILDRLDEEDFQPRNEEQRHETYLNMYFYVFAQIAFAVILIIIFPLWFYGPIWFAKEGEKPLPFRAWYPYNSSDPTLYVVSYAHQVIGVVCVGLNNIPVDLMTVGLIAYVGAECDILSNIMRNMRVFTRERMEKQRPSEKTYVVINSEKEFQAEILVRIEEEDEVAKEMNNTLLECIQQHRKILKFAEDVNEMFDTYVFILFATSLLAVCLTLFLLSVATVGSGESISLAVYAIGIFYELLLYCYFGNELIVKSDNIAFSLYECCWYDCPPRFKKNMLFFILRTNLRPIKMMGVKFFVLSLPSFTAIMRSAWSFFMMLHQMHNKKDLAALQGNN